MSRKFMPFTENNDHEGETWIFWLQNDGNEYELDELDALLAFEQEKFIDKQYELNVLTLLTEEEVDLLCQYGGQGYMDYHNKVTGVLTTPAELGIGTDRDVLYKGGIEDLFR